MQCSQPDINIDYQDQAHNSQPTDTCEFVIFSLMQIYQEPLVKLH